MVYNFVIYNSFYRKFFFIKLKNKIKREAKCLTVKKKILCESIDYWIVEFGCAQYK